MPGSLVLLARLKVKVAMTQLMLMICEKHLLLLILMPRNTGMTALS